MAIEIPGFEEAIADERRDRALAFLPHQEIICGIPVVEMTPVHMERFRLFDNPFVVGGAPENEHIWQAMWFLSPDYCDDVSKRLAFMRVMVGMDTNELEKGLDDYIQRMFLDSYHTGGGLPYYSAAAGLVYAMSASPFGWPEEKTLASGLPKLFQLIKARDHAAGITVVNKKSQKISGDWLDEQNAINTRIRAEAEAKPKKKGKVRKRGK